MANLTDRDIADLMNTQEPAPKASRGIVARTTRKLLVIGCGDGGCNIASEISRKIPEETYTIAYNTSNRTMNEAIADVKVIPSEEDGAGKVREYSKDVFKKNAHKKLLDNIQEAIEKQGPIDYVLICTTADGGTGSGISPMTAKLISDNTEVPVIVLGVYPSMQEDATAQFNALQWQSEIEKIGVTYIVMDNNQEMSKPQTHIAVNKYAARIASLIAGCEYGNTNISMIDNRNLFMLLSHVGGRVVAAIDDARPTAGQSLDDYIENALQKNFQPLPSDVRGIGVFVRGSKDVLDKMNVDLPGIQSKYGNAVVKFAHLEESEIPKIAVLLTGCSEAAGRLAEIKSRYDDIMQSRVDRPSILGDMLTDTANPLGGLAGKKTFGDEADLSALDL